jgi:hypothetical protein
MVDMKKAVTVKAVLDSLLNTGNLLPMVSSVVLSFEATSFCIVVLRFATPS